MKRSRTCLNLFELDTPAAPKRTCSLPSNLGSFSSSSISSSSSFSLSVRQNQERLLFLQQHAASTLAQGTAAAPATIADGAFVVESIVRSQRSLNEITIHEGQQFIGQESNEAATAVPQQQSLAARVQSSEQQKQQQQQQPLSLFGGAVIGSLFEDGGDSSDYFCGVDSSDEADEDSTVIAASAAAECAISTTCDSSRGAECARQVSDADDNNASCARQVSDSSSSSCSSASGSGAIGGFGAERYAFEGDDDSIIGIAADPFVDLDTAAAAGLSFSLPAAHHWGGGGGGGGGVLVPPQPLVAATGPHAGGSWQPAAAGAPRVSVRISGGGGGVGTSRERSMTVPPPWPATMLPTSALMNGWSAGPIAGAGHSGDGGNSWRRQRQGGRRRCRGDSGRDGSGEEDDGSLVSAAVGLSDDAKMLIGMNRLRLVDLAPENASF
ncbi:unnamed protein product [Ectocarpus sp. CCAP 1310/34]|nr:unnamed protein product [Ectocarpus sp. CCAP 1310/34]